MNRRKQALASSISALLSAPPVPVAPPPAPTKTADAPAPEATPNTVAYAPVAAITPNPRQPRQRFDQEKLEELAQSLKRHGILQPLVVTKGPEPGRWVLLAGERRLRAAQLAGLNTVPIREITATEEEQLELSIVENVQRDDLNPVEEAKAYRALMTTFGWTQEQIAERVGKSRPAVANALRTLTLSAITLEALEAGRLSAGHARAILQVTDPTFREQLRREILEDGLTVRGAELRASALNNREPKVLAKTRRGKKAEKTPTEDVDIVQLRDRLIAHLQCPVRIRAHGPSSGTIELTWQSLDNLDRILEALGLPPE